MARILKRHKNLFSILVFYGALIVFVLCTNPRELAVGWLLVPFVLLYGGLYLTFKQLFSRKVGQGTRQLRPQARLMAGVAAATPTLILLLDSVNQLTIRDTLLLLSFGLAGVFYVSRLNFED